MTTPQLAEACGVSTRRVISWVERGYIRPTIQDANGHGSRRIWNKDDLAIARLLPGLEMTLRVSAIRQLLTGLQLTGADSVNATKWPHRSP